MKEKSDLAIKLKSLRYNMGVSSKDVADSIGIKDSAYRRYEIDTQPKPKTYILLADYFGVTVDYLMNSANASLKVEVPPKKYITRRDELTPQEKEVIKKMRSISPDDLNEVLTLLYSKKSSDLNEKP